jgi:HECT-domain (ubiquitin-transferase)
VLSLDFSTMEEAGHCKQKGRERYEVIDLIPNGRDIPVTDANKREFMRVS